MMRTEKGGCRLVGACGAVGVEEASGVARGEVGDEIVRGL